MFDKQVLGSNIRFFREKLGLSQAQLAERVFVSFQAVSVWERGISPPDINNLCRLAELFDVTVDTLLHFQQISNRCCIAVDGGGTKSEFILFSESGAVRQRIYLGPTNPNDIGIENSARILQNGIDRLLIGGVQVVGIFVCLSGAGTGDNKSRIQSYLEKCFREIPIFVESDTANILALAPDPACAMGLICGTGTAVFVRMNRQIHRFGGWGYLLDEGGSGYDIGLGAIRTVLAHYEGTTDGGKIVELLRTETEGNASAFIRKVYQGGKRYIAGFAGAVFEAAEAGDPLANELIVSNAACVSRRVDAAIKRFDWKKEIIAGGGLLKREIYRRLLQKHTPQIVVPELPAVYGACLECLRQVEIPVGDSFRECFMRTYEEM